MELDEIKKLIRLVEKSRINELEVVEGSKKIKISKGGPVALPPPVGANPPASPQQAKPKPPVQKNDKYHSIKSPIVGTFYRSPGEDGAPFAREGETVGKGQTLCIVEAMKLMNEIESDVKGRIVQILPENGAPVEYGELLFKIDTSV